MTDEHIIPEFVQLLVIPFNIQSYSFGSRAFIEYPHIEPQFVVGVVILAVWDNGESVGAGLNDALRVFGIAAIKVA